MGSKKLGFLGACSACALLSCSDIRAMQYDFAEMSVKIGGGPQSSVTEETLVNLQTQNQTLQNQLQTEKNTSANLQSQLQTLQTQDQTLQTQLSDKNKQYSELNAKFKELNNQNQDWQEKFKRIDTLDKQIEYRKELIESSEELYNDVLNKTEDAHNTLKNLEKQVDEKKEDLNGLEKEIESQKANKDEIQREIMSMSQYNIGDLESELTEVIEELAKLDEVKLAGIKNKGNGNSLVEWGKVQEKKENLKSKKTALETLIEQYDTFKDASAILCNREYNKLMRLEFKEEHLKKLEDLLLENLGGKGREYVDSFIGSLKEGYDREKLSEFFKSVRRMGDIENKDNFGLILAKNDETPLFYANVLLRASRSLEDNFWSSMFDVYLAYMFQALSKEQQ